MNSISLNKCVLYAYHGCMEEEALIGAFYQVDVTIFADLHIFKNKDDLSLVPDYTILYTIVKEEMAVRSKLIETVAGRICKQLFKELPTVQKIKIRIAKRNPPMGGNIKSVAVNVTCKRSDLT